MREKLEKAEDERLAKLEAERKAREAEEQRIAMEKKRAKLELKEKLKKEGKWLSKKDLIKKKAGEARLQALIEAGVVPGGPPAD